MLAQASVARGHVLSDDCSRRVDVFGNTNALKELEAKVPEFLGNLVGCSTSCREMSAQCDIVAACGVAK